MLDCMADPVYFSRPTPTMSIIQLLEEVLHSLILCFFYGQSLAEVADIVHGLQLWDVGGKHHGEETDEEISMLT